MRSLCHFVERSVRQLEYSLVECRSCALLNGIPLFDGPVTSENVLLMCDLFHLPYKMGELGYEYVFLLSQVFGNQLLT